jgi:hypothetical protein
VFGLGLIVFASPGRTLWASSERHWLLPFVLWFALIVLGALTQWRRQGRDP